MTRIAASLLVPGFNAARFRAELERDDDRGEDGETGRDEERQAVAVYQGAGVAGGGCGGGGGEDRQADRGAGLLAGGEQGPGQSLVIRSTTSGLSSALRRSLRWRPQLDPRAAPGVGEVRLPLL